TARSFLAAAGQRGIPRTRRVAWVRGTCAGRPVAWPGRRQGAWVASGDDPTSGAGSSGQGGTVRGTGGAAAPAAPATDRVGVAAGHAQAGTGLRRATGSPHCELRWRHGIPAVAASWIGGGQRARVVPELSPSVNAALTAQPSCRRDGSSG